MRTLSKVSWAIFVALCGSLGHASETNHLETAVETRSVEDLFSRGKFEATVTSGVLFSPFIADGGRPTINYTITEIQVGYMLADVGSKGWTRGNFELIGDGFGSAIFEGPGTFIAGVTFWGRYNFVQPGWRFVPFAQGGLGLTSTDIPRHIVGQPFNFNLELGVGTRYFVARNWSIQLEYRYQHISNANTGPHNLGINGNGPVLGVSYLF